VPGGTASFDLDVQRSGPGGPVSGRLDYHNATTGVQLRSTSFSSLTISGNTAAFAGECTSKQVGPPCRFAVVVARNDHPAGGDTLTISLAGGPLEGGTLRAGRIRIDT
jgi:hypothetical protein